MDDLESARADFADGFAGEIFYAEDAGFDEARAVWNAMINRRPAVIARCRDARDVQTAVRHAVSCDLPISIRGGRSQCRWPCRLRQRGDDRPIADARG